MVYIDEVTTKHYIHKSVKRLIHWVEKVRLCAVLCGVVCCLRWNSFEKWNIFVSFVTPIILTKNRKWSEWKVVIVEGDREERSQWRGEEGRRAKEEMTLKRNRGFFSSFASLPSPHPCTLNFSSPPLLSSLLTSSYSSTYTTSSLLTLPHWSMYSAYSHYCSTYTPYVLTS